MNGALELASLEIGYGEALFEPLCLRCESGEITAVLGSNGRGKTSLLCAIAGVLRPLGGKISFSGGFGYVPQLFTPHFSYTALDIVLMGRARHINLFSLPSESDVEVARQSLRRLGILDLASRSFNTLSGGQRQMILIARALAAQSNLLLLDEPTGALDLQNQGLVLKLLKDLAKSAKMNIVFSTHEPTHALLAADNTLLFLPDKKWLFGKTSAVLTEDNLLRAYGVEIKYARLSGGGCALVPEFGL
ncbi:MAG: ABC transporter ATP-binding protein [Spirochaetaceae bacterium]|jgi:iron complex transport system ATP-binding protein|nr:ABC transporter ATP-binding protein [Spirochaetaceae bacterium]